MINVPGTQQGQAASALRAEEAQPNKSEAAANNVDLNAGNAAVPAPRLLYTHILLPANIHANGVWSNESEYGIKCVHHRGGCSTAVGSNRPLSDGSASP